MIAPDDPTNPAQPPSPSGTPPRGGHGAGDHGRRTRGARRQGRRPDVDGARRRQGRCGQEHALPPVAVQGRAGRARCGGDLRRDRDRRPRLAGRGHAGRHRRGGPPAARPLHRRRVCRVAGRVGPRPRGRGPAGARVAVDAAARPGRDLGGARDRAWRDPPRHGRRRPARGRRRRVGHAPCAGHRRARRGVHRRPHRAAGRCRLRPAAPRAARRRRPADRRTRPSDSAAGLPAAAYPVAHATAAVRSGPARGRRPTRRAARRRSRPGWPRRGPRRASPGPCCRSVRATSTMCCTAARTASSSRAALRA